MAKEKKNKPTTPKYEVVGIVPGPIEFRGRNWDLSKLTDEDVVQLISLGCEYIKVIDPEGTKEDIKQE